MPNKQKNTVLSIRSLVLRQARLSTLVFAFVFAACLKPSAEESSAKSQIQRNINPTLMQLCVYEYKMGDVHICSEFTLTESNIRKIVDKYNGAVQSYKEYAESKLIKFSIPEYMPSVFVISPHSMNSDDLFVDKNPNANILSRYSSRSYSIFITRNALQDGVTDFEHEVAHCINDITGNDDDEYHARRFEKFLELR